MKKTLIILRAYSWPASAVPVIIGSAVSRRAGAFSWTYLALTLLAALSVHSGANLANTYFDFRNGVDKPDFSDDRALVDGLLAPRAALKLTFALFAAAAAIGGVTSGCSAAAVCAACCFSAVSAAARVS